MDLATFISKCKTFGFLPDGPRVNGWYSEMKLAGVIPQAGPAFNPISKTLAVGMSISDFAADTLDDAKKLDTVTKKYIILNCHEIYHNLHYSAAPDVYRKRYSTKFEGWTSAEERLTITGTAGSISAELMPADITTYCKPGQYNEYMICDALGIAKRNSHADAL